MALYIIGLNHTTAPIALRERIAFAPSELGHALLELQATFQAKFPESRHGDEAQIAVLSTCNRMEVYVHLAAQASDLVSLPISLSLDSNISQTVIEWLARYHDVAASELSPYTYTLTERAALNHAFCVASGMNSMVLGEPQILGQMKQALRIAHEAGTVGTPLLTWFDKSFAVAKQVRTQTAIGEHSVSMAAAALKLAKRVFEDFRTLHVLLVGAGEMMDLVAAHMVGADPAKLTVANRSLERASELLAKYPARQNHALRLNELADQLAHYDVVVTCTASTLPLIGLGMVEAALKARRNRPMVMVDLGVPRDIEPAVAQLSDVFLYSVDDLSHIVAHNNAQRTAALAQAQAIVDSHVAQYMEAQSRRTHKPQVRSLRARAERMRQVELARAQGVLAGLVAERNDGSLDSEAVAQVLAQLSSRLVNKLLHAPTLGVQSTQTAQREAWQRVCVDWLAEYDDESSA